MTHPASRSSRKAPVGAVELSATTRTLARAAGSSLTPVSAIGTRPALHGAVADRIPSAIQRRSEFTPLAPVAADIVLRRGKDGAAVYAGRRCRVCGTPIEAGTYLRLRHAVRRPRGAVNHYPR